jgi:hypothetical protein
VYAFLGLALCLGAAITGCGDDDEDKGTTSSGKTSGEGQSCQRSADCSSSLVCIDFVCSKGDTSHPNAGNDGSGGSTGGTGGSAGKGGTTGGSGTTPALVLGGEGESCTRRADCAVDLHCFNQRCVASEETGAAGAGGMGTVTPPPSPVLGALGETCLLTSDCVEGLSCLPNATTGAGVCSIANTGITPTGKSCIGECESAADCCELPVALQGTLGAKSCADLAALIGDVDCGADASSAPEFCFAQATYCECDKTWACTDSQCVYKKECSDDGLTTDGCPTYSRSGHALPSTCIDSQCAATAAPVGCEADDDCESTPVADDPTDTCSAGECTCYKTTGLCYRACDADLDCAVGYSCDGKKHVCVSGAQCDDDVTCQKRLRDARAVCNAGTCAVGCNLDLDCNSSLTSFTMVCNAQTHVCEDPGCRSNSDCFSGAVQMFCIDNPAAGASVTVASAITD